MLSYIAVRNSLMIQHKFVLTILLKNIESAIVVISKENERCGKILKFMYMIRDFNEIENFNIPENKIVNIIDCAMNSVYSHGNDCRDLFIDDCSIIAKLFHLNSSDIDFYYFIACVCYYLEYQYNKDKLDISFFTEKEICELEKCVASLKDSLSELIEF